MAALAPLTTPGRQPFGILNDSKIRSLQSLKNRQNAITPSSAPSLKRRAVSPEGGSDSENVDPNVLEAFHKRKRSAFNDDVSVSKSNRYSLNVNTRPSSKPRLNTSVVSTPRLDTFIKPSTTTPASAPAAGRSPTRKRSGHLSRKRFNPPPFSLSTQSPSLSLSAALNGTKKPRLQTQSRKTIRNSNTIEDSKPKSWFFDIYEESQETQDYRMNEWTMIQNATGLDISDDESKTKSKSSDRGKENVDPNETSVPVTRAMAAAAAAISSKENAMKMDEEDRKPLADLNPVRFYADGLDATSVTLVHDEAEAETDIESDEAKDQHQDFSFQPPTITPLPLYLSASAKAIEDLDAPSLSQILTAATPNLLRRSDPSIVMAGDVHTLVDTDAAVTAAVELRADTEIEDVDIEIWESESAKDENEKAELDLQTRPRGEAEVVDHENVFALQEL